MRTVDVLLFDLRRVGVKLSLDGDELRCRAPGGALSAADVADMRAMRAQIIEALGTGRGAQSPGDQLVAGPRPPVIPVSVAQHRLWLMDKLGLGGTAYNIGLTLRLDGALDERALRQALDALVVRHEALRTRLVDREGRGVQLIDPPGSVALARVDLIGAADPEVESVRLADREAARPFDLARGPLLRAVLLRISPNRHRLVMTMHHAISDGWSVMRVLFPELLELYAAGVEKRAARLPALDVHYADFALWQHARLQGDALDRQAAYWRERLDGAPALLDLPTDRPRPARQRFRGARVPFGVPSEVLAGLRTAATGGGATLFMVLLSAWAVLLARWSGQDDIVVGTPVAGRDRVETENLIGFFVNTLPLRLRVAGTDSFRDVLSSAKSATLGAFAHQDMPFDTIVHTSGFPRTAAWQPLVQALLVLHSQAWEESARVPGLEMALEESENGGVQGDVVVHLYETSYGLQGWVHYDTDLFDAETALRMAEHFAVVLGHAAEAPERKIAAMDVMPAAERQRVLVEWNRTEATLPDAGCVHERIGARAARDPGRAALSFGGETLTYGELDRRANQLARHLVEHGIGPEAIVGICLERSPWMTIAILAVLKAGGAYLPLDPRHPADRLDFMMEDADAAVLIVDAGTAALPLVTSAARIVVDRDWAEIARRPASAPPPSATPSTLAYAIYTSGSTGRPKGVLIEHAALSNRLLWMQAQYRLSPGDVVLQKTPYSFDVSVWEFLWTLSEGARLEVARPQGHLDPVYLGRTIRERGVTVVHFVPSMLTAFMNSGELAGCDGLRLVFASGEALPHSLAQAFLAASPAALHNLYGPTEAAIDVTYHRVVAQGEAPVPIGRPIWNTRLFVLDEGGAPVPQGVRGELNIAGRGLARGYLGLPGLTDERFVDLQVGDTVERAYRTGDIVRWRNNGELEFLGRMDDQVKLRGFRIELGEIEACLATYAGIREVAVIAREDAPEDKRLVAYFAASGEVEVAALRAHLAAFLPEYMVPAAYVRQDGFALTPSGKLDRNALPAPDEVAFAVDAYTAPEGEVETALAVIWAEVLGVPRVGRHDDFFALGGNSMLALKVLERILAIGWQSDIRDIFDAPDIAGFAPKVGLTAAPLAVPPNLITSEHDRITPDLLTLVDLDQDEIDRIVGTVPGGASNIQDIYPLTPLQEGILFHHLLEEKGDTYLLWSLLSAPDRDLAVRHAAALEAVMQRHDALRTSVVWEGLQRPVQVVWRRAPLQLEEVEFTPEDGDIASQLVERFNPSHFRINLRQAPLMRGFLAQDAREDRWLLLFMVHHLVDDATSLRLLMEEVRIYLEGLGELPQPVPFRNFVARSRGADEEEQTAFFSDLLAGIQEPTAPFGILDVRASGAAVSEARCELDPVLTADVRAAARAMKVSAASLFHAACGLVIGGLSAREEALFGTVLMGRMQGGEGSSRVVGAFINTLPIRVRLGSVTAEACVQDAHAALTGLMRHETAPLRLVQRCSEIKSPAPLFTAIVNYRRGFEPPDDGRDGEVGLSEVRNEERTNYPLALIADDWDDRLILSAQARAPIDPQRVLEMLRAALTALVQALAASPDTPMSAINCLSAADRARLLPSRPLLISSGTDERRIHELFEEWARRRPDATAVAFGQQRWTYHELNAEANRLARFLVASGVASDSRVAICVERSPRAIVAVLAVLKAGGGYVPIEPGYPVERIAFILADAAPGLVLADVATTPALRRALASTSSIDLVSLEADAARWAHLDPADLDAPVPDAGPQNLAYIIYTSGSTGTPKGVMIEHRSLVRLFTAARRCFDFGEGDVWTLFHSLAFDFSVWEMWGALAHGGRLVLVSQECVLSPERYLDLLCSEAVTVLNQTPGAFLNLMAAYEHSPREHRIRLVFLGGEALRSHLLRPWVARNPLDRTPLVNLYGITETTVIVTWHRVSEADLLSSDVSRIGVPLPDLGLYILDQNRQLAPIGVTGEIYISGAGLARGYLNRPELTAERFLDNPFAPGERFYRSGDLGRLGPDGMVDYIGRADDQVKLRGFRVELGEIEACLSAHPAVREAVVQVSEIVAGDKRLVAYFVAGEDVMVAALRTYMASSLPAYMVPAAYVQVDRFELTTSGKIDRYALSELGEAAFDVEDYEVPEGEMETALAEIWRDVLGVQRVGRHDNFFALGGDSMLVQQVALRARDYMPAFAVTDIFSHPTVAEATSVVLQRASGSRPGRRGSTDQVVPGEPAPASPARPSTIEPIMRGPASFGQRQLWILDQLGATGGTYSIPATLRLESGTDVVALTRSLTHVFARHAVLRTRFEQTDAGEVEQVVESAHPLDLPVIDLRGLAPELATATMERTRADWPAVPFDLARGPLMRAALVHMGGHDVLLLNFHHIAFDGWSMQIFLVELQVLYGTYRGAGWVPVADPLPPMPIEYLDYAIAQRDALKGAALDRDIEYWRERLDRLPPVLDLPADRPRPVQPSYRGRSVRGLLPPESDRQINALARRLRTTPFTVLMACYLTFLAELSGRDDVVTGTPYANRGTSEIEGLIGYFVNTVVVRLTINPVARLIDVVANLRDHLASDFAHQDLPFEQLVNELRLARSAGASPVFQSLFTVQNNSDDEGQAADAQALRLSWYVDGEDNAEAKFDVSVGFETKNGQVQFGLNYSCDLFDDARGEDMARRLAATVSALLDRPDDRMDLVRMALRSEAARLCGPEVAVDARDLAERFADVVAAAPDRALLSCGDRTLSAAAVDERSRALADAVADHDAGPDVVVAVCVPRAMALPVALLATWRAGAAYLPVDADLPDARIAQALADAGVTIAIAVPDQADRLRALGLTVVEIDADTARRGDGGRSTGSSLAGDRAVRPDNLAYVLFTSGSTGRPKGVAVTRANLANLLDAQWATGLYGRAGETRASLNSTFTFDVSLQQIGEMLRGGHLRVLTHAQRIDSRELDRQLRAYRLDLFECTPSQMIPLLDDSVAPHRLPRRLLVAGEALPPALWRDLVGLAPGIRSVNAYGPTEFTVYATSAVVAGEDPHIGTPIGNCAAQVLDRRLRMVAPGATGELCLSGANVVRGYAGRPDLTADAFRPDPGGAPGSRLYRTGDLVRTAVRDGDEGTAIIEIVGRADQQMKLRGYRIEAGEVEAALRSHPDVAAAVVALRTGSGGDKRLVAFVEPGAAARSRIGTEEAKAALATALTSACRTVLPPYMVPSHVAVVERIPLTASGKVDAKALPAMDWEDAAAGTVGRVEAAADPLTDMLLQVYGTMLDTPTIGPEDNFFDLGGTSLLAMRVSARLRDLLGTDIRATDVLAYPTVAALAVKVGAGGFSSASAIAAAPPRRAPDAAPLPPGFVRLRPGAAGAPLLVMPFAATGRVEPYRPLVAALGDRVEAEIVGVESPWRDPATRGVTPFARTLKGIVGDLMKVAGDRRIHLVGWSFGGVVAHDLAVRLDNAGRTVSNLILLDPHSRSTSERIAAFTADSALDHFIDAYGIRRDPAALERLVGGEPAAGVLADLLGTTADDPDLVEMIGTYPVIEAHLDVLREHREQHFEGSALLIRATDPSDRLCDWANLVDDLEVRDLPVSHSALVGSASGEVARLVEDWIAGAAGRTGSSGNLS